MVEKVRSEGTSRHGLFLAMVLATAMGVLLWRGILNVGQTGSPVEGSVVVAGPASSPNPDTRTIQAAAIGSGGRAGSEPSGAMKHALALTDGAVVRDVLIYSRQYGISCGEVSLDGNPAGFKRFFYIAEMKTGGIDDGTEEFRSHAANVCTVRN